MYIYIHTESLVERSVVGGKKKDFRETREPEGL